MMFFPFGLNGKIKLDSSINGDGKPEFLHNIIVSSLRRVQGCSVQSDNFRIEFTNAWNTVFRRGSSVLGAFTKGEINICPEGNLLIIDYKLSVLQDFIIYLYWGSIILLAIRKNLNDSLPPSASIGFLSIGLLWCLIYLTEYISISIRLGRFLRRSALDASEQLYDSTHSRENILDGFSFKKYDFHSAFRRHIETALVLITIFCIAMYAINAFFLWMIPIASVLIGYGISLFYDNRLKNDFIELSTDGISFRQGEQAGLIPWDSIKEIMRRSHIIGVTYMIKTKDNVLTFNEQIEPANLAVLTFSKRILFNYQYVEELSQQIHRMVPHVPISKWY